MTLPASIRVNPTVPFPTLVTGSGPVIVKKTNGIWTIGLTTKTLAEQFPVGSQLEHDYLIVYDEIANTFFKVPLVTFRQVNQRSIASATDLPIVDEDAVLNLNNVADLGLIIPLASSRSAAPLTFKNLPGSHVQTLLATAPDTLEGVATIALGAGQSVTLVPYSDGVNDALGYAIES